MVDTIEKMDEEIEYKDNKITILEDQLKGLNQYDKDKINEFLNHTAKPSVKRDRAIQRLLEDMNNANKTFKQLGVKPIKF